MSRFADSAAVTTVQLGPCDCPGTPHESDWVKVRSDLSALDIAALRALPDDDQLAIAEGYLPYVIEWNLLGPDGTVEITAEAILALDTPTLDALVTALAESVVASLKVPKAFSAPSAGSSRAKASRTRTTRPKPGT